MTMSLKARKFRALSRVRIILLNLTWRGSNPIGFDGEKSPTRAGFSLVILVYNFTQILSIEKFYARENREAS